MSGPETLKFAKSHEWASREGSSVKVGISDHAQKEITDVVFVDLPKPGRKIKAGESCAVVESVKAAFDIYAPVSGQVVAANKDLESDPALVNKDLYGRGWFFEIEMTNPQEWESLLKAEDYKAQCTTTH